MSDFNLAPLRQLLEDFIPQGRTALLPALHAAQDLYGYLPKPVAAEIGHALAVPLAEVYGVIDFYTMFSIEPVANTRVHICSDIACQMAGSQELLDALNRKFDPSPKPTNSDERYTVEATTCLGLCNRAPAMLVNNNPVAPASMTSLLDLPTKNVDDHIHSQLAILTANCNETGPTPLVEYEAQGGYWAFMKALKSHPENIIAEIKASRLVGRGGAAFPTGVKWESAAKTIGSPKYVVCNADESEPGTFKDRILLERDPHRTLEGMLVAAYATGASKGFIYIRGEYRNAFQIMTKAVEEARSAGYIGQNILGTGFDFEIELRLGAGAYICGEETALFESIEGQRGFPRVKPPFPTTHGLFGKPTVINNVETLCNVPYIIQHSADAYRRIGTEKSTGSKLFCLSGDVLKPGLYEVPFGITLRHLVYDLAGGLPPGSELQTVLVGGAAGAFATQDHLDVLLSFEDLRDGGLPLGSGVIMVIDHTRDIRQVLLSLAKFFAHESCGKCYPCQIGTQRQYEILERLAASRLLPNDAQRLSDVGWTMTDASLCGLGQTAAMAVISAMKTWPDMFREKTHA